MLHYACESDIKVSDNIKQPKHLRSFNEYKNQSYRQRSSRHF